MTTTDRPQTNRNYNRRQRSKFFVRRRVCQFCVDKVKDIDYKNIPLLQKYMSEGSKIDSRRKSGVCAKHQRILAKAIKRARQIGMLPFDRSHKFVIKQTYQRGPAPRTNEETTSSNAPASTEATATDDKTTASDQSGQTTEAAATDDKTTASDQSGQTTEAVATDDKTTASDQSGQTTEAAATDDKTTASDQSEQKV